MAASTPDRVEELGIVGRSEEGKLFHRGQKLVVDELRRIQGAGVNGLEADGADFCQAVQGLAGVGDFGEALSNGGGVVGALTAGLADPLHTPLSQHGFGRHIEHPELEGSAPDIWDQALHFVISSIILVDFER